MLAKRFVSVILVSSLLMGFGLLWMSAILRRCEGISPAALRVAAQKKQVQATATKKKLDIRYVRSPAAKDHHFLLFWFLTCWEIVVAALYFIAGFALLRLLEIGRPLVFLALWLDVLFKIGIWVYMTTCAIPLAQATKNPNILLSYFYADSGAWERFSGIVSGLAIFQKATRFDLAAYFVLAGVLFYFMCRPAVKAVFQKHS